MELNGTKKLLALFDGNEDAFIEHFIKSCYFLSEKSVENRTKFLLSEIKSGNKLPIRYTSKMKGKFISQKKYLSKKNKTQIKKLISEDNFQFIDKKNGNISVFLDSTGNQSLVNAIEKDTGYLISTNNSNVINYTISHIWANTTHNPYFFSSFWNVAIIPTYLNYIMDKPKKQDSLNDKIQEIMKAIILQIYRKSINIMYDKIGVETPSEKYVKIARQAIKQNWINYLNIKNDNSETQLILTPNLSQYVKLENQEFIFKILNFLEEEDLLLKNLDTLTDKDICLELFGHYRPILIRDGNKVFENGTRRYYKTKKKINNQDYYVTNDWYKKSDNHNRDNRNIFLNWISELL